MDIIITKKISHQKLGNALESFIGGNIDAIQFANKIGIDPWEVPDLIDRIYHGKINGAGEIITKQSKLNEP